MDGGRGSGFDALLGRTIDAVLYARWPRIPRRYREERGAWPSIAFPRSYTERIQWRKLIDHNPLFVTFADKLATKGYLARVCPELAVPRTLWVGTKIEDAPKALLSGSVVVKASSGSGTNAFIRDGRCDREELKRIADGWMSRPFGRRNGEWAYWPVARRIFIEELLGTPEDPLLEIGVRAGRGRIAHGSLTFWGKTPRQSVIYIDETGRRTDVRLGEGVRSEELADVRVPSGYEDAVHFARRMSEDIDFARYDFLFTGGRLYGGEITIYPASGFAPANAYEDVVLKTWDLRTSWFMTTKQVGWRDVYRRALARHLDRTGQ